MIFTDMKNQLLDVQWLDIDIFDQNRMFTFDPKYFPDLGPTVQMLEGDGAHYLVTVDPGIAMNVEYEPFTDGLNQSSFLKDFKGDPLIGAGPSGDVVYPDFYSPQVQQLWQTWMSDYYNYLPF